MLTLSLSIRFVTRRSFRLRYPLNKTQTNICIIFNQSPRLPAREAAEAGDLLGPEDGGQHAVPVGGEAGGGQHQHPQYHAVQGHGACCDSVEMGRDSSIECLSY